MGIIRQLQRLIKNKGVTPEQLQIALENYAADPYVQECDVRLRKPIRSFFTYENVMACQKPIDRDKKPGAPRRDAALSGLELLDHLRSQGLLED